MEKVIRSEHKAHVRGYLEERGEEPSVKAVDAFYADDLTDGRDKLGVDLVLTLGG